mmetsp:Transcript_3915/g.12353  ORF Transcript_3915/g.12353 Transcript_3915/m.12353 type:complete len:280 (-) Transcript_3915:567-1406(-)
MAAAVHLCALKPEATHARLLADQCKGRVTGIVKPHVTRLLFQRSRQYRPRPPPCELAMLVPHRDVHDYCVRNTACECLGPEVELRPPGSAATRAEVELAGHIPFAGLLGQHREAKEGSAQVVARQETASNGGPPGLAKAAQRDSARVVMQAVGPVHIVRNRRVRAAANAQAGKKVPVMQVDHQSADRVGPVVGVQDAVRNAAAPPAGKRDEALALAIGAVYRCAAGRPGQVDLENRRCALVELLRATHDSKRTKRADGEVVRHRHFERGRQLETQRPRP